MAHRQNFSPIAIVGQGCVLPAALNPAQLWQLVATGRDVVKPVPEGVWGGDRRRFMATDGVDGTWTDRGGYVEGFEEHFDPDRYAFDNKRLQTLGTGLHWLLHAGSQAIDDGAAFDPDKTGVAIGNLSFPTRAMSQFAERVWYGDSLASAAGVPPVAPTARFMSGLPAQLLAEGLGLGGPAVAMDAACASALYAIAHGCSLLNSGQVDAMVAGAVNYADDLLIHVGFCALTALSKSGRSRPFHRDADGLVPARGAGLLLLKRLADAQRDGDNVLAVIRGVGLSNDGRGRGFLAPSADGQARAMRQAYAMSGLQPKDIGLVECHATGTQLGDRTELESMAATFEGCVDLPIGSLKSNMGHLITAAGVAGVLKVMAAMKARKLPPTLHAEEPIDALRDTPFKLLHKAEDWPSDRPLRAAVSAFGFGGNNAHLIVEHYDETVKSVAPTTVVRPAKLAVVSVGAKVGEGENVVDLDSHLRQQPPFFHGRAHDVTVTIAGLRVPPRDLQSALPQQLAMVGATQEALTDVDGLDLQRVSALVGMGCDPDVSRHAARWRLHQRAARLGIDDSNWLEKARDNLVEELDSATLLGCMPNIAANRLNHHLQLGGPSMTVSAEELSGLHGLQIASHMLADGTIDAAVVGAVDFSCNEVHEAALVGMGHDMHGGDGAVALLVTTEAHAAASGWPILATLQPAPPTASSDGVLALQFGKPHAAWGLLKVVAAIHDVAGREGQQVTVSSDSIGGQSATWLATGGPAQWPSQRTNDGPTISVPAHRSPPNLPPLPTLHSNECMPLVPTEGFMAPRHRPKPHAAAIQTASEAPTVALSDDWRGYAGQVARAQLQHMAALHDDFVRRSATAHEQFLQLRRDAALNLLAARSALGSVVASGHSQQLTVCEVRSTTPTQSKTSTPTPSPQARVAVVNDPQIVGPSFSRAQLEVHSRGAISSIYGDEFAGQDGFRRQVRMPEPPLLLADRVLGIEGAPRSMGRGRIWTETDVRADAWYLHDGRMPAGVMIEAGQADLMLISWLGIDFENRGERVYRLLGCDLTYSGGLLRPGDTIRYEIHCDGHARQGNIGLFFFHYDGTVDGQARISVRNGQAGFFTDADLANSNGILWRAQDAEPTANARLDAPPSLTDKRKLSGDELRALAAGDAAACFGDTHRLAATHTRPPRIAGGRMLFVDEVTAFEPSGGPWQRGYLRAVDRIESDDWFFDGHFHNDPCMPGTLMFEGCLQAMAVYMSALGLGLQRDGWRFEPVPDVSYPLRCRGQVLPGSKELVYEVFVDEIVAGPIPTLWADILCTIDGLGAFWCRRMGLQLSPGWPLDDPNFCSPDSLKPWQSRIADATEHGQVAYIGDMALSYRAMMNTAWGAPSEAFGPMYQVFDGGRRVARLPGPPYHFMSRVEAINQPPGQMHTGITVELAWDIPADGFFFAADNTGKMPFCVLLEAALQPCGWLASYVGCATTVDETLFFRNLDGTGTWHRELSPSDGALCTRATLTKLSKSGAMILVGFDVHCTVDDALVYELSTGFGFFPAQALANQAGLPVVERWQAQFDRAANVHIELRDEDGHKHFSERPLLPSPSHATSLWMLERVTVVDRAAGAAALGQYRAEQDVDADAWYFKAHFFQDAVQPGSLGLEAISQLLRYAMVDQGLSAPFARPRFAAVTGAELTWKYRGQVLPKDDVVTVTLEVTSVTTADGRVRACADGALWVDGRRIYEATNMTMDIVEADADD